uniref:BTB domain-containing protein n=1 Tax=Romanomermis culicivorax TaxID=13658 RepID=A0A915JRN6_ROMCU
MGDRLDEQPPPSSNNRSSSSSGANSPSPLESPAPVATPTPLHHTATQAQQQQSILSSTAIVNMNMAMLTQSQTTIVNNGLRNRNANVDQGLSHPSFTSGNVRLRNIAGPPSQYIKLNVGGYLHYTTVATLTKHDSMLRGMFSGRMEVLTDAEGWVLIDRCGKHFTVILNFLRDGAVALPESTRDILEILSEARYYCIQSLIDLCQAWLDLSQKNEDSLPVCRIPIITSSKEEKSLLQSTTRPTIKLLINRHNNKYSYTSQSDDNLLKNLELFDKLIMRFHERVLFIKDVGAANEVCSWTFYGHGQKVTEVCCTSIVYATDKKHTKVRSF